MRILLLHQYFRFPSEGGGIRTYYLAKALVEAGHELEIISAHNETAYKCISTDGFKVHYLPVYYNNSLRFAGRSFAFLKFIIKATQKALSLQKPDLCYAVTTPLSVAALGLFLKKFKRLPYVLEVGDLWPEAPVQMGFVSNRFFKKSLYALEKKVYQEAEAVIPYSIDIESYIKSVVPGIKTTVITNFADCSFFTPVAKKRTIPQLPFLTPDSFVVTYTGTFGKANHLNYLIECAYQCQLQQMNQVQFILMGEGAEKPYIKSLVELKGLSNVHILPHGSKEQVREVLYASDAAFVSFLNIPVLSTGCPNKYFDALAAGRLVIINMKGWIYKEVEARQCGFFTDPDFPEVFPKLLKPYVESSSLLRTYQENARRLAEQAYSTEIQLPKFTALINSIAQMLGKRP